MASFWVGCAYQCCHPPARLHEKIACAFTDLLAHPGAHHVDPDRRPSLRRTSLMNPAVRRICPALAVACCIAALPLVIAEQFLGLGLGKPTLATSGS